MGLISRVSSRTYRNLKKYPDTMNEVQVKTEYDPDHTKMNDSQKIFGELNVLKSADGSALITDYSCQTQILAAIHGPGDVRETRQLHGQMGINVTFLKEQQPMYEDQNEAEVSGNQVSKVQGLMDAFDGVNEKQQEVPSGGLVCTGLPLSLQQNSIEQDIKSMLYETLVLSHFKRAELMVTVQVLQNCGNIRSNTLNAVVLALLDAGVPMKTTPLAVEYDSEYKEEFFSEMGENGDNEEK